MNRLAREWVGPFTRTVGRPRGTYINGSSYGERRQDNHILGCSNSPTAPHVPGVSSRESASDPVIWIPYSRHSFPEKRRSSHGPTRWNNASWSGSWDNFTAGAGAGDG